MLNTPNNCGALFCSLILVLLTSSCGDTGPTHAAFDSASSPSPSQSIAPVVASPTVAPASTIRSIDFKNFTFPWYPNYLTTPSGTRSVTLIQGELDIPRDDEKGIESFSVLLTNVSYADLTGDGDEEAIVDLGGTVTQNSFVGCLFVYRMRNGKPEILLSHETGDRAAGGLRRVSVEGHVLIIDQYEQSPGSGLCCPKYFRRHYFEFAGRRLRETKSETRSAENSNAEFLGYPAA